MPEHSTADNRGQIDLVRQTATVLFIGQKIGGERQPTLGEDRHETVAAKRTNETIERHRRNMANDSAQF